MARISSLILILAFLSSIAGAQLTPGDYVAPISSGNAIVGITPGGTVKTIFTMPFKVVALTMASNNVDLAVLGMDTTSRSGILATVTSTGLVTTVAKYSSYIYENMGSDWNGDYMVPIGVSGADMVLRFDRFGAMTTVVPNPKVGGGKPRGIAVDITTGGYFMGDIPNLFLIARDGTSTLVNTNVSINNSIDIMSDARTGNAVIAQQNSLVTIDTFTGMMTTIAGGFNGCFPGLAYDRSLDAWVLAGSCANTNMHIYRVTRGGSVTTVANLTGPGDLEVYGSRNIVATGDPSPGSTLSLRFNEPNSPGALYIAAASLSTNPGIPTPAGIVDLTPDDLFMLSQLAPSMFINFLGVLDANGSAIASVAVPAVPALKGFRFFISFVTIKGSAISTVANTAGFTIQ